MARELNLKKIGDVVDVSAVKADADLHEVDEMIRIVRQYSCVCAAPMPWSTERTLEGLKGTPAVVTGVVGFPSGATFPEAKAAEASRLVAMGCKEIDMVMNIGAFKSGLYDYVQKDIEAVIHAVPGVPVKAILEIAYLTDEEICRASELVVKAGVTYVKTGTGWGPKPTTVQTIELIRGTIGDSALIKAAGGVRDLDTLLAMYGAGCDRFGLGVRTSEAILQEAQRRAAEQ